MQKLNAHLSKELTEKYGIKRFPIRKGDIVKIVRGDSSKPDDKYNIKGKEGKVLQVLRKEGKLIIENVNIAKADGKMKPKKIDVSKVVITKLELEDKIRKEKLEELAKARNKTIEEEEPIEGQSVGEENREEQVKENGENEEEIETDEKEDEKVE